MTETTKLTLVGKTLLLEALAFFLGLFFVIEPIAGIYYYLLWFSVVVVLNVVLIVPQLTKRPPEYLWNIAGLLLAPLVAVFILCGVISMMM
ncbi:hypothetical protein ACLI09_14035 [Flavobacterium sp. RHBU_24]|uniref:hypothetical protein n=1 Tax=Flavobacterium sp. RHBU_24 TaxID=3391185 RepID=UPI003984F6C0